MRFADIILDLAALASASRSVASRHLELRAKQIDRYTNTSSIFRSLQEYEKNVPGKADSASTQSAGDATQQTSDADAPVVDGTEPGPVRPAALGKSHNDSPPDAYRNLFQSRPSLGDAATQARVAARPDQSAILAQLREKAKLDQTEGRETTSAGVAENSPADVPPGINVNIFHTRRGAQTLEGQKDGLGQLPPKGSPPKPSWFKDFGHDQPQKQKEVNEASVSDPVSSIPKSSGQGSASVGESAAAVNVASPQAGESIKSAPETKMEASSEAIEQATSGQPLASRISASQVSNAPPMVEEDTQRIENTPSTAAPSSSDEPSAPAYVLRESTVPATRISRLWNYGGLAAGMLGGALSEGISRGFGGGGQGSVMFSAGNMERLVAKLSRMRGAALKLGQMMSFQDSKMLPGPIQEVLQRVQDRADYMPAWQRDRVLTASLGPEWRDLFEEFEDTPIAAASIGQVHRATLKSGEKVAVKIQFPGVADSINSDLDNISILLKGSMILPKGLYLNKTIDNARTELGWECDYERELECGKRYKELLATESDVFSVPEIYPHASGKHVLTMQFMEGVGVTRVKSFTQAQRDWIGTQILRLCLREIVEFRFMQTDPNWTNFLYNATTNKLELLDFGASREFPALFVTQYVALLAAAARQDRDAVIDFSQRLGYLTGHESRTMLDAHVASILAIAEPFLESAPEVYDFADQTITERVRGLIPVMMRERLSPPPEETYSLHRKLSGAFLLCARLGSQVRCRELFKTALEKGDRDAVRD